ncbi:MAG: plasmid maintenance toxin (PemK-like) [Bosea sp. (in: a-proteobacteria)]
MVLPVSVKPVLRAGAVFQYAYLWHREFLAGQTEARKDRPALALAVAVSSKDGRSHVLALPITHSQPKNPDHGVALPPLTKSTLGLDEAPSWVITTEAARFAWPGPDVRKAPGHTGPICGFVSEKLLQAIAKSYLRNRQHSEAVSFDRYD